MNKKQYCLHLMMFICSAAILGMGTALFVKANLGGDALSTFAYGIHHYLSIPLDIIIFIVMYLMMAITWILDKRKLGIASFLYPFISSFIMKIGIQALPDLIFLWHRYIFVISGILCMALAIAIGANTKVGYNPYDSLAFALKERFHHSYTKIRWIIDGCFLVSGMIMKGRIGIGTILVLVLLGVCADIFLQVISYVLQRYRRRILE